MKIIAVACDKGGVGKTSITVGVACALAEMGKRVLLIDCDGQGGSTRWLGLERMPGLSRVFTQDADLLPLVRSTRTRGVDVVPASLDLATLERSFGDEAGAELRLRRSLERLPKSWDAVLIDTPPTLGLLVTSALVAATDVLIPVEARPLGVAGIRATLGLALNIRRRLNPNMVEPRVVLSRTTRTKISRDIEREVRDRYGWRVLGAPVPERVSVTRASGLHLPVGEVEPRGAAANALRKLAHEILAGAPAFEGAGAKHSSAATL
jgi:chromosome partitioning protein